MVCCSDGFLLAWNVFLNQKWMEQSRNPTSGLEQRKTNYRCESTLTLTLCFYPTDAPTRHLVLTLGIPLSWLRFSRKLIQVQWTLWAVAGTTVTTPGQCSKQLNDMKSLLTALEFLSLLPQSTVIASKTALTPDNRFLFALLPAISRLTHVSTEEELYEVKCSVNTAICCSELNHSVGALTVHRSASRWDVCEVYFSVHTYGEAEANWVHWGMSAYILAFFHNYTCSFCISSYFFATEWVFTSSNNASCSVV